MNSKYTEHDWRSLAYHQRVAEKIRHDPALINIALENIRRWKAQGQSQQYLDEWLDRIAQGPERLLAFLVSESDEAQRLRSSSPFAGILTEEERQEVLARHAHR